MVQDASHGSVECHWRQCVSAPKMDECDDEHLASATKRGFVPCRKDAKP